MSDVINLNSKRPPVIYTVTIVHHYDDTLEFRIEDVSDDGRSREAVMDAFRRISGAADEIEKLQAEVQTWVDKTKQAVWSDSDYCKLLEAENKKLRAALKPFADEGSGNHADDDYFIYGALTVGDLRAAAAALKETE